MKFNLIIISSLFLLFLSCNTRQQGNISETESINKDNRDTSIISSIASDIWEQKGIEDSIKKSKLNLKDVDFYLQQTLIQLNKGNSDSALELISRAIFVNDTKPGLYYTRATIYQRKKQFSEAIHDLTKALELDPTDTSAYYKRAIVREQAGDFVGAKSDLEVVVGLIPMDGEARTDLGVAKLNLGDKSGACKDFELAKKLGDDGAELWIKQECK
ncbi:MAG: tetratricopeptide repeat protein [Chitinophagales bacterium]